MRACGDNFKIPPELEGEDVYNMLFIFDNENEAVDYIVREYKKDWNLIVSELHEEDSLRKEYDREQYLRSCSVSIDIYLRELLSGEYILWEAY